MSTTALLRRFSNATFTHRPTTPNPAFAFTPTNLTTAKSILAKYPEQYKKAAIIPLLDLAQRQNGNWTSVNAMNAVAELCGVPKMRVYEVATFYTMFNREPVGKYFVEVCTTTPCQLGGCGSDIIVKTLEEELGIKVGHTTPDGNITMVEVECAGACVNAPVLAINNQYYEDLTPETTKSIIASIKKGVMPPGGPQKTELGKRMNCEPNKGLTTLQGEITGPGHGLIAELQ